MARDGEAMRLVADLLQQAQSRIAAREAISKARTLESTSWNAPSISSTRKSITGKPASGPESITELMPFSTPGMYSLGTAPPTILLSKL